jgi:3-deoxy-D-manno-octulosonate 8-phosphate phosphatase (KDO 8-P phosphatase)
MVREELKTKIQPIRLVAMDVDGVLTEGRLMYTEGRGEICCFHIKDGMGLTMARQAGLQTAIISGRLSEVVFRRATDLKIPDVFQGVIRKVEPYEQLMQKYHLTKEQVCYIGDDVNDLPVLRQAGLAVAVADAVEEVRESAHYVTRSPGGGGAVREVIDLILHVQGLYDMAVKAFDNQ